MAEKEMQAHDMVRRRNWTRAVQLYDQILAQPNNAASNNNSSSSSTNGTANGNSSGSGTTTSGGGGVIVLPRLHKDRQIACLLGRCECLLELQRYEQCLADARKVLTLLADQSGECLASVSRARRWLVHALCKLKKYAEAEQLLREWIGELMGQQSFSDISKTLERYKSIIQMINGHKSTQKISQSRLEDEMSILDTKLDHWATNNLPLDKYSKLLSNKGLKKRESAQQNGTLSSSSGSGNSSSSNSSSSGSSSSNSNALQKTTDLLAAIKVTGGKHADTEQDNGTYCSYCALNFDSRNELRQHCQTERHQNVIMSYEGRDWKWRPPPRGFTLDSYSLCEAYQELQTCHYGNQCVEAHGTDELNEWKERFEYRRMRLQKASEKELYGKSYTEQILEQWIQATAPERVMCERVEGIEFKCEQALVTSISSKSSKREWLFLLRCNKPLRAVALLQDAHRNHFTIKAIRLDTHAESKPPKVELKSDQEWVAGKGSDKESPDKSTTPDSNTVREHQVTVEFRTDIYGTFRQAIGFDFGSQPLLVKHLCVDVVPVNDVEKIEEIKRDIISSSVTRWDPSNTNMVKFETTIGSHLKTDAYLNDLKHEREMLERYPCPRAQTFTLTQSTIMEKRLTQNNYRSRIHELLYIEEIARYDQIARYNVRSKLTVTSNYILTPAGMATSTAKYSLQGELFALMRLGKDISEDTSAGRLILSNCSSVYVSAPEDPGHIRDKKRNVYEATIEDKGKNVIYLKLSSACVDGMSLKAETEIEVDIQFQLNRLPYCEWHNAVDKITDFKLIFPPTEVEPNIPWTPKKQWSDTCEPKLNAKQREAVNAITTSLSIKLPPILLIGPFGTGKTYTLAQAIKQLLTQPEAKILICTHSNSAADLYIKEYLHPWIEEGLKEATPLRVYYHKRWVATVNGVVQKYCITDGVGNFRRPSMEDIKKHRIVVVTLSISMELAILGLPKGYFTHIFLDEAAQAMECEAIMPLALANDSTRIVLAGDHMQMSPELFSAFAKERKLHISLLERLYDHYPSNFPCKILLCENYRAHEAIIKFTSELFYDQKLIASGKQPRHDRFYPLTFFTTRGEDVQDKNSTAFYNNAEVYEVVERVSELRKKWPNSWGKINDASIGIMTPYADQVFRIRSELRKRRMGGISVERVLNVQGKQFRAVFLSTVRTRRTCLPLAMAQAGPNGANGNALSNCEDADYGFLSNSKLLNTAITRAQSLVAVVGDPVALCSIGRCRKVWERFIEICDENKSLFGITWSFLRSQLDGVELKRGYVLNPLAPEFIPRALQPEAYLRDQAAMYMLGAGGMNNHHGAPHGGPHHNAAMNAHAGMLAAGSGGQMPPHHGGGMPGNQQMPHMFPPHSSAAYNAGSAAAMMNLAASKNAHHFPGHPNHLNMRAMGPHPSGGPQQIPPPPLGQQYNMRGPPPPAVHLNQQPPPPAVAAGQFGPYMPWQQTGQQLRGGPPTAAGGNYMMVAAQQQGPPQTQNPNASLWGPPPQSNPWSVLPKQPMPPQGPNNVAGNVRPPLGPPPPSAQQASAAALRGGSVPLQPPPNAAQMRANSNELGGYMNKKPYGQHGPPPAPAQPPHGNFAGYAAGGTGPAPPPNQLQLLNQRNMSGIPNGPISPMEPFLARPQTGQPVQNSFFGPSGSGVKEKDFQFLNNVHMPPLNAGNMFQPPATLQPPTAAVGNKQQSPSAPRFAVPQDYVALLPPNMTIYDMTFESKEMQYKWYLKLLETSGQEAANKYNELLNYVQSMLPQQHGQQQPGKPTQAALQPPPPHMNVNQLLPRELMQPGMLPLMNAHQPQQSAQQQQQQQQRNSLNLSGGGGGMHASTYMNHMAAAMGAPQAPTLLPAPNDDTPPLDGINFNQQIDLAFNTILNGNNTQPILRDLFNSGSQSSGMMNGDLLLSASTSALSLSSNSMVSSEPPLLKMFPATSNAGQQPQQQQQPPQLNMQKGMPPPWLAMPPMQQHMQAQQQQQQQQANAANAGLLGGAALLNNKDLLLGAASSTSGGGNGAHNSNTATSSASVPLYLRQAMTSTAPQQQISNGLGNSNSNNNNNANSFSNSHGVGHILGSSANGPENILTGGTTDILSGLGTNASNLIEALFQSNNSEQPQQQLTGNSSSFQKMFNHYDNYTNPKKYEMDMFLREQQQQHGSGGTESNNHHHHGNASTAHYHNNVHSTSQADNRNTTYAAVLSQGQHQQHQQQQQQQQQHQQHQQQNQQSHSQQGPMGLTHNSYHGGDQGQAGSSAGGGKSEELFAAIRELGQGTNGFYNYFQ